jgi:thymidylate synthase (FAD)
MPIFVARQWVRHRTARLNEISGRYSVMQDEFYLPEADQVRKQCSVNKQGRGEEAVDPATAAAFIEEMRREQREIYGHYEKMLEEDVARELARVNLPLSLYTEWYWQIDLHNLFHFLKLRTDAHAQYEIRVYGEAMAQSAKAVAPMAYEAFEEYSRHARTFSREELEALREMTAGRPCPIENARRRREFFEKLESSDPSLESPTTT